MDRDDGGDLGQEPRMIMMTPAAATPIGS